MKFYPVCIERCTEYNDEKIEEILRRQFSSCEINREMLSGKKIVIKPNMVMNKEPDFAATTNPAVIAAAARVLQSLGASNLTMAESSGGPYTVSTVKSHYNGCKMTGMAQKENIKLSMDVSSKRMSFPDGVQCRSFNIITPVAEADIIVNVCKLKTHALTKMSCGVKNFYGAIPGTEKVEMHARFPRAPEFQDMLIDLCSMLCQDKIIITICDGIVGMEENGPTGGTPRDFGVLLTSLSPFCLDAAAEEILGFKGTVGTVHKAALRMLAPEDANELNIIGDPLNTFTINDVVAPDTSGKNILRDFPDLFGGRLVKFLEPRPKIRKSTCIGCGKCAASCPAKTIRIISKSGKKKAHIDNSHCIRCYCCQELCPINSVAIKKNFLLKVIH